MSWLLDRLLGRTGPLFETLRGPADFSTMEHQLLLRLTGDGKGQVELQGQVADQPGVGNRLHFTLQFDQSQLDRSLRELESVIARFPVRDNSTEPSP